MSKAMTLMPSFEINLGNTVVERTVCVGRFDGIHASLACSTVGGKVFVHSPHERSGLTPGTSDIKYLNINRIATAVIAGPLIAKPAVDILMIGTQTNLLAYNLFANTDVFYKDVPDGISAMCFGRLANNDQPYIFVGGNCSIQGFDSEGTESFWTVTGDNVTALTLFDYDRDGRNELLVGSEDYAIRVFQGEEVVGEISESDKVMGLMPCGSNFVYSLGNCTVGAYYQTQRLWRNKTKSQVTCTATFDIDCDGVPEVLVGWASGRFEVRKPKGGDLIFKDTYASAVSGIVISDYRMTGREEAIVVGYDGTVRGYTPGEIARQEDASAADTELLDQLMQSKQSLQYELAAFEEQIKKQKNGTSDAGMPLANTKLSCKMRPNSIKRAVELVVSASEGAVIKSLIVSGELFFGASESQVVYAENPSESIVATLAPEKDVTTELTLRALVGQKLSENFHVFEMKFQLPKFGMYVPVKDILNEPKGSVTTRLNERINRIGMWLNNSFNVPKIDKLTAQLDVRFVSLRDGSYLVVSMSPENGQLTVRVDSMDIAGEVIQDLGAFLGATELESVAEFPAEFAEFEKVLLKVDEYNSVRLKLTAEMADSSQLVKALVIKAEDARILSDMPLMKKMYGSLYDVNRELIGEYIKRSNNHVELLSALKDVNSMIQKAAGLRMGSAKALVISQCRNAIKGSTQANSVQSLFKIIRYGKST